MIMQIQMDLVTPMAICLIEELTIICLDTTKEYFERSSP